MGKITFETIKDLADYIVEYADVIVVRVEIEGKGQSKFLAELPATDAIREAMKFIKESRIPVRLKRENEIEE